MRIRAVIFDIGGVLIRTDDRSDHRKWEVRLGMEEGGLAKAVLQSAICARVVRGQATITEMWREVAASFSLTDTQLRQLKHDFWAQDLLDYTLVQALRDLRPRYRTALLSNAGAGTRATLTQNRRYQLGDAADLMVISAEEGIAKPDPRIYHLCVERLGVDPRATVFIDDQPRNLKVARDLGMIALQFQTTAQILDELHQALNQTAELALEWSA